VVKSRGRREWKLAVRHLLTCISFKSTYPHDPRNIHTIAHVHTGGVPAGMTLRHAVGQRRTVAQAIADPQVRGYFRTSFSRR